MATIYISSIYADLKDCRKAVYKTLFKMKHDVIAMEEYVAVTNVRSIRSVNTSPTAICTSDYLPGATASFLR